MNPTTHITPLAFICGVMSTKVSEAKLPLLTSPSAMILASPPNDAPISAALRSNEPRLR